MQPHFAFCNCFTRGTHSLTRLTRGGGGRPRPLTHGPPGPASIREPLLLCASGCACCSRRGTRGAMAAPSSSFSSTATLALLCAAAAAGPPPPPPAVAAHSLADTDPSAVCIDGSPGYVYANATSSGSSTTWVIQLGPGNGGAGLFCWMDPSGKPSGQTWDCTTAAKPKTTPAPSPPPPRALGAGGPQDTNCTRNPDWCKANMAKIEMCSMDLMLGDATRTVNGTTMHFKGQALLRASIRKLASLGLDQATAVVLTGETHAGTAAVLNADAIGAMLHEVAPSLKVYKVLPADPSHPRVDSMFAQTLPGLTTLWMDAALQSLASLANVSGALAPACLAQNASNPARCMWFDQAVQHVNTPTFVVQQMPGTYIGLRFSVKPGDFLIGLLLYICVCTGG